MDERHQIEELQRALAALKQDYESKKVFLLGLDQALDLSEHVERLQREIAKLNIEYQDKRRFLDELVDSTTLRERNDWQALGIYELSFSYETSVAYKVAIQNVVTRRKEMIRRKQAATCATVWRVNNSIKDGQLATDLSIKFTLRAFNNECEAILSRLRWNNFDLCAAAIRKAYGDINRLKQAEHISIADSYLQLWIYQLQLTFEQAQKVQAEKEEARRVREIEREKLKVERELEQALNDTEKEQERYRAVLAQARDELGADHSDQLKERVADLEIKLAQITKRRERALSMAQLTRSGYIYVISNLGSFGETVFKIGMTRRLDPMERIRELGDASVPFAFDVHAIIWTTDAPALEARLHQRLHSHRVNQVNYRKEFFRAEIGVIRHVVLECVPDASFDDRIEAAQFGATVARLAG